MEEITVALVGNPNVGKSTLFNALTGLRQHTGNWPGKTVERAEGTYLRGGRRWRVVDLPGTYSLLADSPEEEVTRTFLGSGAADITVVVADATALSRSLALALQVRLRVPRMVLCVNLMDEAERRGISVEWQGLRRLGIPVAAVSAGRGEGLETLCRLLEEAALSPPQPPCGEIRFSVAVERALHRLEPYVGRTEALRLLLEEEQPRTEVAEQALGRARVIVVEAGLMGEALRSSITESLLRLAEEWCCAYVKTAQPVTVCWADRLLTGRVTGPLLLLLGLSGLFALTLWGSAPLSELLGRWLPLGKVPLHRLLELVGAPLWLRQLLVDGAYRTAAWVAAVMFPPMAIFFPLFTLLEDMGLLPRVAFCLDRFFQSAGAHGRQSLTMAMALGCNVCGITGCRIIDTPRERLIAIVTNSFVPCNGRLPTLLALTSLFFAGWAAVVLPGLLLLSLGMTWLCARLLSATALRGRAASFSLELPPYRKPRVGWVLVRSLLDRTLLVLGRAVSVAAPAGMVLWVLGRVSYREMTLLQWAASLLEGPGALLGLDGMILLAFLLAFPAGELLLPVLLMGYLGAAGPVAHEGTAQVGAVLAAQGWTGWTALCTMVMCLFHFPCGTGCLTVYKETGSWRITALAMVLPAAVGVLLCLLLRCVAGVLVA